MNQSNSKSDLNTIVEIAVIFFIGALFALMGGSRLAGGYVLYSNVPTAANFAWVEYTALLLAFGLVGMISSILRIAFLVTSRGK